MTATMGSRLQGASTFEQDVFDSLVAHEHGEAEILADYEAFAETSDSATVRYLVNLIVEDERRHHRMLNELANTIRYDATHQADGARVPYLDITRHDRVLRTLTRRFLARERADRAELRSLARRLRSVGADVDAFVVGLMLSDTERHIRILRFIDHTVRRSPFRARSVAA